MDWNARYAEGDTPWDKGAAHPVLDDESICCALSGSVLVPGCGTGHDARALAKKGLKVTGLDISPLAIGRAEIYPSTGNIAYHLGDLFALPEEMRNSFEGIFEHTCFCAIEPAKRADYVSAVRSALKPGGRLLSVFFLDPDNGGDGPPHGCTRAEIVSLFLPFFRVLDERRQIPTFPEREGRELLMLLERV